MTFSRRIIVLAAVFALATALGFIPRAAEPRGFVPAATGAAAPSAAASYRASAAETRRAMAREPKRDPAGWR